MLAQQLNSFSSYVTSYPFSSYVYTYPSWSVLATDSGSIVAIPVEYADSSFNNKGIIFSRFSDSGEVIESKMLRFSTSPVDLFYTYAILLTDASWYENKLVLVFARLFLEDGLAYVHQAFCVYDLSTGEYWTETLVLDELDLGNNFGFSSAAFSSGNLFVIPNWWGDTVKVFKYDVSTQSQVAAYSYFNALGSDYDLVRALDLFPSGDLSVLLEEDDLLTFLKITGEGEVVAGKQMVSNPLSINSSLGQKIDDQGNVYVTGIFSKNINPSETQNVGMIFKFDSSYQLMWAKELQVEQFEASRIAIQLDGESNLIFTYTATGDLPVIYGKLDANGNLLEYQGFSFYDPAMDILADGSVFFFSPKRYLSDGSSEEAFVVAKTDVDGQIHDCPQYPACIEIVDRDVEFVEVNWIGEEGITISSPLEMYLSDFPMELSSHCNSPTAPTPYFTLPDTICAGDCLSPDSLYNRLAHHVEWYISGPGGLDTTIVDTTFTWCFEEPGTYEVEQGVWLLGCSDFYQRELVVLSDEVDLLEDDRTLCEEPPYSLSVNAGRPLTTYLWSDGSTNPELSIISSGSYSLEASDGYCILRDSVQLTFLQDLLTQGPPLSLPEDTTVCEQHLPYLLQPYSPYTEVLPVQLWEAGVETVEVDVFGCPVIENFELSLSDCRSRIYFPTAFSPNGDGINDLFLPQGKDYAGIELQIYDRWGGLLFSSRAAPFAWAGGDARPGVYTYLFRYLNTLSGE